MLSYLLDNTFDYSTIVMWVLVILIAVGFAVWMFFSSKKRKQQEQEAKDLINAVKPGNKVKTIGGVCGIVVEVNSEENTFVLETGSEAVGKSYVKFDKQAIYQTDAVVEKQAPAVIGDEATPAEDVPETQSEETATEAGETSEKGNEESPVLVKPKKEKKAKAQTEENND